MHSLIKASSFIALFLLRHSQAKPIAQGGAIATPSGDLFCSHDEYTITEQKSLSGQKVQLDSCTPTGRRDCTVGRSQSYTIGVTVQTGASLDFSKIVGVGVSASVATTTTKGVTNDSGIACGGPWTCSAIVTPEVVHVKGEKKTVPCTDSSVKPSTSSYEVTFPKLNSDKLPLTNIKACACPDFPHSADKGAPEKCPNDCGGH